MCPEHSNDYACSLYKYLKYKKSIVSKSLYFYLSDTAQAHFEIVIIYTTIESPRSIIHSWGLGHFMKGKSIVHYSVCIMQSIFIFNANIIFLWGDYSWGMLPFQNVVYVVQIFILRWKKGLFPKKMLATFKNLYFLHFHLFLSLVPFLFPF